MHSCADVLLIRNSLFFWIYCTIIAIQFALRRSYCCCCLQMHEVNFELKIKFTISIKACHFSSPHIAIIVAFYVSRHRSKTIKHKIYIEHSQLAGNWSAFWQMQWFNKTNKFNAIKTTTRVAAAAVPMTKHHKTSQINYFKAFNAKNQTNPYLWILCGVPNPKLLISKSHFK